MPNLRKNARIIRPYLRFPVIPRTITGWWELFRSARIPNLFKNPDQQTGRGAIL